MAIKSKGTGKSSGARIIYFTIINHNTIVLLDIYDKSNISNVSVDYIKQLIKTIS